MTKIDHFMKWGKRWRAKYMKPFFRLLTALRVRPNHITFVRALGGPAFVLIFPNCQIAAVGVIIVASLIDWIDGGLARYQKLSNDRGKFWDVLIDHLNYVFPVFTLIVVDSFNNAWLGYHLIIVPVLYLLATIKESEGKKTDWIIHPYYTIIYFKPIALLAIALYVFSEINIVNETVFSLNIAMTIWALYYSLVLSKRWRK